MTKGCQCGPQFIEDLMKKVGLHGCTFNECCEKHDLDYKNKTKTEADKDFLCCMIKEANGRKSRITLAYSLYYLVVLFGNRYYRKSND